MERRIEQRLSLTAEIPSGSNYDAWRIQAFEIPPTDFNSLAEHLIGYAILGASTHNAQPWMFGINGEKQTISLWVDESKILAASDETGRQSFISVGCALANLEVAAKYYGYEPQIKYTPDPDKELLAIQVNLEKKCKAQDERLFRAITTRAVNRSEYYPKRPVLDSVIAEMQACVADPKLELHLITNRAARQTIALAQETADTVVMHIEKFRRELGELLIPNDSEEYRGMPGHNFGLTDKQALELHQQLKQGGRLDPHLARGLPVSDRKGIISSPILGIICISEKQRDLQVKAGQAWQRMALIAESYGVNMSIHAALAEVEFSNWALKKTLRTKFRPTIIFRAGYATEPRPHSPRIPVEKVIFYEES